MASTMSPLPPWSSRFGMGILASSKARDNTLSGTFSPKGFPFTLVLAYENARLTKASPSRANPLSPVGMPVAATLPLKTRILLSDCFLEFLLEFLRLFLYLRERPQERIPRGSAPLRLDQELDASGEGMHYLVTRMLHFL